MPSSQTHREALRALLRRVDEVRGLSSLPPLVTAGHVDDTELLLAAASELVDDLEQVLVGRARERDDHAIDCVLRHDPP